MIYVDTSVLLAQLLAEDRVPPAILWSRSLVSSRLIEYELWNRIHARKLGRSHAEAARAALGRIVLVQLTTPVLARALEPFPAPVRTLDALHLATIDFLRERREDVRLASYDRRLNHAATRLGIPLEAL